MLDLHELFRQVLHRYICPSNGTVLRRHKLRYPDDPFPLVTTTSVRKYQEQSTAFTHEFFHHTPLTSCLPISKNHARHYTAEEGWGDDISQYYVVEDMLKIHPGHLMQLFVSVTGDLELLDNEHDFDGVVVPGSPKGVVEHFVAGFGEWFENNGETLAETVQVVISDRGGDVAALREGIEEGWEGIARREDD